MNAANPETDLAAENTALKAKLAAQAGDEKLIAEKMASGLTRGMAISAIKRQRAFAARRAAMGGSTQFTNKKS